MVDHFTRWQDALAISDATATVVATALDERVFCYMGLPEQIHTDQGAQFESQLMTELCQLWGVKKTRTTPYHPQANGMVERNNRGIGDSLRAMLLRRGQDEWDILLPQLMRAYRGTPHTATGETANVLMMGRELRLPDQLQHQPPPEEANPQHDFVVDMKERLEQAHEALRQQQLEIRQEDQDEPLLFAVGDMVWLQNRRRRRGDSNKLQPKFVGPYQVLEAYENHTYLIDRQGQDSVQNEVRLKLHHPCSTELGKAPASLEPRRRPNMKGALGPRRQIAEPSESEVSLKLPPIPSQDKERALPPGCPVEDPEREPEVEPTAEPEPAPAVPTAPSPPLIPPGRPSRTSRKPIKYQDYECYPFGVRLDQEGQEGVTADEITGKKTLADQAGSGPAASRPGMNPLDSQETEEKGVGRDSRGEKGPPVPMDNEGNSWKLCDQEWPALSIPSRNTRRPAMSRRVEMGLEPPGSNRRMPQDYAIVCKKRQVHNYRSTVETERQSQELLSGACQLPQEVSELTRKWPFYKLADSHPLPVQRIRNNPVDTATLIDHPQLYKMDSDAKRHQESSDGESESSLLGLLQDIPDINGDHMVEKDSELNWSDGGLLSESDTELEAALKVAAPSVQNKGAKTGSNSQITVEIKSRGDKSQPKPISVLKVTEGLEMCSITQTTYLTKKPRCVVPHKEMPTSQTTVGQVNRPVPAVPAVPAGPAVSRVVPSINDNPVLLEVMEDNTWFHELEADPSQVDTSKQTTVRSQSRNSPSVSPVLKVTGGQESRAVPIRKPNSPFALKVAKGSKGDQSPPICRVNRINTVPSIVEDNQETEAGTRVAVISPVKPPANKRLRVELTRYEPDSSVAPTEVASKKARLNLQVKRIPTTEWVSRSSKEKVEQAVVDGQSCRLCEYNTSKRRIRIHIRQHYFMHFCQCGFQHISRDQVADHQRTTRRSGHSRDVCQVFMVEKDQFPLLSQEMGWPKDQRFGPLLPVTANTSSVETDPRSGRSTSQRRDQLKAAGVTLMTLNSGYQIPKKPEYPPASSGRDSPTVETHPPQTECSASPPAQSETVQTVVSEQEGERRWYTKTKPQILVVETRAKTTLEQLLERSPPSEEIPRLRTRQVERLEGDADRLEDRAREVDAIRRRRRHNEEEKDLLRSEASKLRVEAARLRALIRQLLD